MDVNEITRVETDHNGEIIKIHYDVIENGIFQEYEKEKSCYYRLCLSFTPDHKNMLESEYKPVIISCIEDNSRKHIRLLHQKCEVLKEKQGGYVQMKCLNCGEVHLIALNSWKIYKPGEVYLNTCTDEKE